MEYFWTAEPFLYPAGASRKVFLCLNGDHESQNKNPASKASERGRTSARLRRAQSSRSFEPLHLVYRAKGGTKAPIGR